jgi:hypothetical protein
MSHVTSWNSLIHQGGQDTGPVVGGVQTVLVTPRWLRFLRPNVFVTVTGLDDVEVWVPDARTHAEACAVHDALVATYREKAHALAMADRGHHIA